MYRITPIVLPLGSLFQSSGMPPTYTSPRHPPQFLVWDVDPGLCAPSLRLANASFFSTISLIGDISPWIAFPWILLTPARRYPLTSLLLVLLVRRVWPYSRSSHCLRKYTLLLILIILPNLRRLTIDILDSTATEWLLAFLSTSGSELTYLDITFSSDTGARAIEICLVAAPNVSMLKIHADESASSLDYRFCTSRRRFRLSTRSTSRSPMRSHMGRFWRCWVVGWARNYRMCGLGRCGLACASMGDPDSDASHVPSLSAQGIRVRIMTPTLTWPKDDAWNAKIDDDSENPFPPLNYFTVF
ncbi:hypothetical protein C8J57DRAFT_1274228 [Mycena rebaudengoi]|nr:hypothetical protein C8J57DRAFT_1274228 [Mycena rebaudengoi]